jgi:hypothetical protein
MTTPTPAQADEKAIREALAPWWKKVCEFTNMPGIPASVAGDELVAIVAALRPEGGAVAWPKEDLGDGRWVDVHPETLARATPPAPAQVESASLPAPTEALPGSGVETELQELRAKVAILSRGDCVSCHGTGSIEDGSFCSACNGTGEHGSMARFRSVALEKLIDAINQAEADLSKHIETYHDYEDDTPERASLRGIQHHLLGSLIAEDGSPITRAALATDASPSGERPRLRISQRDCCSSEGQPCPRCLEAALAAPAKEHRHDAG